MRSRWLAYLCVCLSLIFGTAWADGNRIQVDIAPKDLPAALDELAAQVDLQMLFDRASVRDKKTPGLKGTYSRREAVERLLAGSGLVYTFTADNAVAIKKPERVAENDAADTKKPKKENDEPVVLPEMTVTASPYDDTSYNPPNATTATKTDTPIMETPVSIQVVPQQVFKDQQVIRLDKALRNVSGVYAEPFGTGAGFGDRFNIRGFPTDTQYRNGMPYNVAGGNIGPQETANLERIEVLKGPASILFGRIEPGGLINLVPKQPLDHAYYSLQQQLGSFDFYRTTIDASGPLMEDNTLGYRLNLAYENSGSFRDLLENDRVFVAPVLRWNISDRTQVTFELEYKNNRDPIDIGVPALGNRPAPVPRESYLGERGDRTDSDYLLGGFNWSHAFNDSWTLRQAFYANSSDALATFNFGFGLDPNDPTNRTVSRFYVVADSHTESYYTTLDLTGKFNTWGMEHTLLLGGDYSDTDISQTGGFIFPFPSIDLFDPIHVGPPPRQIIAELARLPDLFSAVRNDFYGLYLQDQVRLPYDVHLLAGFRYDNATALLGTFGDPTGPISELTDDAVTPRFGLLWRAAPQLTLYGNYVENFGRSNLGVLDRNSEALPPESAQQWEVGVKTETLDGRFTGTLAYYDLTKQNVATPDPDPLLAAQGFSVAIGEVRNRGVELDLSGEVLPGWRWIGGYSYIDSEITKDNTAALQGNRLFNVPRHGGSLWTTYEVQQSFWRGLTLGGGVVARSQVQGDRSNSFQIPGYAAVNLMAGYSWKAGPSKISLQLNVDNLLDKDYFSGSDGSPFRILYGTPRTFLGSVRVEF